MTTNNNPFSAFRPEDDEPIVPTPTNNNPDPLAYYMDRLDYWVGQLWNDDLDRHDYARFGVFLNEVRKALEQNQAEIERLKAWREDLFRKYGEAQP